MTRGMWATVTAAVAVVALATSAAVWMVAAEASGLLRSWARVPDQVAEIRGEIFQVPERVLLPVLARVDVVERDANRRIGELIERSDRSLGRALEVADGRGRELTELAAGIRTDLAPVLAGAVAIETETTKTVHDLHPQLLGLVAASKVTAGETAQTMRDVRDAVPGFLQQGSAIAGNARLISLQFEKTSEASTRASEEAARAMHYVAEATKPLPKWVRYTFGIGAVVAPTAVGVMTGLAATGRFAK